MRLRGWLALPAAFFFACSTALASPELPEINADAAIVIEASTGRVVYEKNADERRYPASLTKMMTAILALENGKPDEMVLISRRAVDEEYHQLSYAVGDVLTLSEALEGMLLCSENGLAQAVAENVAPTYSDFIRQMNRRAAELGAGDTQFVNASGMPDDSHYSTARDMVRIARWGWMLPEFRRLVSEGEGVIEWEKPYGRQLPTENTNELLGEYEGMCGIKTGWTSQAGGCMAAAAMRDGLTLLAIVMHSDSVKARFDDTRALLDYGFEALQAEEGPAGARLGRRLPVRQGRAGELMVCPACDISWPLFEGEKKSGYSLRYELPEYLEAPLRKGQKVGEIVVSYEGSEVGRIDVLTADKVEKATGFFSAAAELCGTIYSTLFC